MDLYYRICQLEKALCALKACCEGGGSGGGGGGTNYQPQIDAINEEIAAMNVHLAALDTSVATLQTNYGTLTAAVQTNTSDITALNTSVNDINAGLSEAYIAGEAISAGDFVNIYDASGSPRIRKASAVSIATQAHGYAPVAISFGNSGQVFAINENSAGYSGLTSGSDCFLSDTVPGRTMAIPPVGAGKISQKLGYAAGPTKIKVIISRPIVLSA